MTAPGTGVGTAPVGMVLGAVGSPAVRRRLATTLFDETGPLGTAFLRLRRSA
jgi:threonine/homoserine efflux transporter RhtA